MSADCFTWHPDQDDVYDGNKCGIMTLNGPPSAFNKNMPYGFTMEGTAGNSLTLEAIPSGNDKTTSWAQPDANKLGSVEFDIQGGTFTYKSLGASLSMGDILGQAPQNVIFNIIGRCNLESPDIVGLIVGNSRIPATEINISEKGVFSALAGSFSGGFAVYIADTGTMQVEANKIDLSFGGFKVYGTAPDTALNGGYSLDLTVSALQPEAIKGITLSGIPIICQSSSKVRLRSPSITLLGSVLTDNTNILAEDNARVEVACNAFTVSTDYSRSFFTLSPGSATFTFSSENGEQKFPIDYEKQKYPKGMFNFIPTKSPNTSTFYFRAMKSSDALAQYSAFLREEYFAINGTPFNEAPIDGYKVSGGYIDNYLMVRVVTA